VTALLLLPGAIPGDAWTPHWLVATAGVITIIVSLLLAKSYHDDLRRID
jgi:hypothetical protein